MADGGIKRFRSSCLDGDRLIPGLDNDVALNCLARVRVPDGMYLLSRLNARFNELIKSGYLHELRKQMGIVEHCLYFISFGFVICFGNEHQLPTRVDSSQWEVTDILMRLPTIPSTPSAPNFVSWAYSEIVVVGNELLAFGNCMFESNALVWKYDVVHQNWVTCREWGPDHLELMTNFAWCSHGPIAIIAGGTDRAGNTLKSAELYDSSTGKWERLPNMHTNRTSCTSFFMDEKFYVIGGESKVEYGNFLTCGEEFDLKTRKWRKIEGMYTNMKNDHILRPPCVAVVDNQLYWTNSLTRIVKKYDKKMNVWDVFGRLPVHAENQCWYLESLRAWRGKLVVIEKGSGIRPPAMLVSAWRPSSGATNHGDLDWQVLGRWSVEENENKLCRRKPR